MKLFGFKNEISRGAAANKKQLGSNNTHFL